MTASSLPPADSGVYTNPHSRYTPARRRTIMLVVGVVLVVSSYVAACFLASEFKRSEENNEAIWIDYFRSGFNHLYAGNGVLILKDGGKYRGAFRFGTAEGSGRARYANGDVYDGEFREGLADGHGRKTYSSGGAYEGEWKSGAREGHGVATFGSLQGAAEKYDGQWQQDLPQGFGTMFYLNGQSYEGGWRNGNRSGDGTLRQSLYPTKVLYKGQWLDDVYNGKGILYGELDRYEGGFSNGKYHGHGVLTSNDRSQIYDGHFSSGKRQGEGKYHYQTVPFEYFYEGAWENNSENGYGVRTYKSGRSFRGIWKNGSEYTGRGVKYSPPYSVFEGTWEEGRFTGSAHEEWSDGRKQDGHWDQACFDGDFYSDHLHVCTH